MQALNPVSERLSILDAKNESILEKERPQGRLRSFRSWDADVLQEHFFHLSASRHQAQLRGSKD